jgi:hypothetical protein
MTIRTAITVLRRGLALATATCALVAACAAAAGASSGGGLAVGTPSHPQGVRLTTTFGWQGLDPPDQPTVTGIELWFPRGSLYNGGKYPRCSEATLDRKGPAACPKASIVGHGTGTAYADTVITHPQITVVNGGASVVYFYTVLNNPARVQEAVPGRITRLRGNFAYHLAATIPENLRLVAGVPVKLTSLTITAGRARWIALTGAPAGLKVLTHFDNGAADSYMLWVGDL